MPAAPSILNFQQILNWYLTYYGVQSTVSFQFAPGIVNLNPGSGASQFNNLFAKSGRSIVSGTPDAWNLTSGALTNPDGTTATFADIVLLLVQTPATNTDYIALGGGTNPVVSMSTGTIKLPPNSVVCWSNLAASAYAVGSGANQLNFAANGGTQSYSFAVLGH
jgi:hypothetical protein